MKRRLVEASSSEGMSCQRQRQGQHPAPLPFTPSSDSEHASAPNTSVLSTCLKATAGLRHQRQKVMAKPAPAATSSSPLHGEQGHQWCCCNDRQTKRRGNGGALKEWSREQAVTASADSSSSQRRRRSDSSSSSSKEQASPTRRVLSHLRLKRASPLPDGPER